LISALKSSDLSPILTDTILSKLETGLGYSLETNFSARAEQVLKDPKTSLKAVLFATRLRKELENTADLPDLFKDESILSQKRFKLQDCVDAYATLKTMYGNDAVQPWRVLCNKRFPCAIDFME
jgi:hypothetical protein